MDLVDNKGYIAPVVFGYRNAIFFLGYRKESKEIVLVNIKENIIPFTLRYRNNTLLCY